MPTPIYSRTDLWDRIKKLRDEKKEIKALKFDNYHTITFLNEDEMMYSIRFRSMKEHLLRFNDLYVMYEELYRNGWIDSTYLSKMCKKLYNKPFITNGPAMMAILYHCDRNLLNENGVLTVRNPLVVNNG